MPVSITDDRVQLVHPKGATVDILLYGATITSWKSPGPTDPNRSERLFLSGKAILDGTKAVRGGIPVVFPIFGPPTKSEHSQLSQHGFARSEKWEYLETVMDRDSGVSVKFGFTPTGSILTKFPYPHTLTYVVTLAEHQLVTDLVVENVGNKPMEFQALLHTYHRVPMSLATITPLKGLAYTDKTRIGTPKEVEAREAVSTKEFTDSVYENAGDEFDISWEGKKRINIRTTGFKDVVIWNPSQEAGSRLSDMEAGGWEHFICIEPGAVSSFVNLSNGQKWQGQQVISVL